jgi:methionine synthase II (cobalamin-independent)
MFAMLGGALPPPIGTDDPDEMVRVAVRAQEVAGLELVTDGGLARPRGPLEAWRLVAGLTDELAKAELVGPYTLARTQGTDPVHEAASARETIAALAAAGCPFIQIDEDAAVEIGEDAAERAVFRDVQRRVTEGIEGTHLSLAIRGGNADPAGIETIFEAPYASYLFDLVAGPDNWRLVARAPGDRGIVCGVADARSARADGLEIMVWAAQYAASTGGRGLQRVGLSTTGSMAELAWEAAVAKMEALAAAARVAASLSAEEIALSFDPRALDKRSAALGRYAPRRDRSG